MKLATLLLFTLPLWPQAVPAPPASAPSTAVTLPPDVLKAMQAAQAALAAAQAPAASAVQSTTTSTLPITLPPVTSPEPSQFYSVGLGVKGFGPAQPFGYFSVSEHIAKGTYLTQAFLGYRMTGGKVGNCALGGVSKSQGEISVIHLTVGLVGDIGGCEGLLGSMSGAVGARGFGAIRFFSSPWYFVATAQDLKIAGVPTIPGQDVTVTFAVGFGLF